MTLAALDWSFILDHIPELAEGLGRTLKVSAIAIAGAFVVGAVLGAARAHRVPVVSQLAAVYVELIRNTPILVQIFFVFFGLPQFGIRLTPFTTAWLSVTDLGRRVQHARTSARASRRCRAASARRASRSASAGSRRSST